VLLNWLGPDYARHSREVVTRAALAAGRPAPRISAYVRVAVGHDAEQRARCCAAAYTGYPAYQRHFKRQEVEPARLVIRARDGAEAATELRAWDGVVDEIIVRPLDIADLDAMEAIMNHIDQTAAVGSAGA
jgi:alkanesulfonate monooxygenase SsuD/methylene tetrahydromethanopterin reductase-like flavin-dependent oxidoreductase (luciferase family)